MKPHRIYKAPPQKARPYRGKCEGCGAVKPPSEVYSYVDGNNGAITANAPYLCRDCVGKRAQK